MIPLNYAVSAGDIGHVALHGMFIQVDEEIH